MSKIFALVVTSLFVFPGTLLAQNIDAWIGKVAKAIHLGDERGLDALVKGDTQACLLHFKGLAFDARAKPDEERLSTRVSALKESWKRVHKSELLDRYDRWVQLLSQNNAYVYEQSVQAFSRATKDYQRLKSTRVKERGPWEDLRESLMNAVRGFEAVGHALDAADVWAFIAVVQSELPEHTMDDQRDGLNALQQFMQHRQAWGWTSDDKYKTNTNSRKVSKAQLKLLKEQRKKRESEGYKGNVRGAEAYLVTNANDREVISELKFKALAKLQSDMSWEGGSSPLRWPRVDVGADGAKHFEWFKGSELFMMREGANKYGVTIDGKAKSKSFVEAVTANRVKKSTSFFLDSKKNQPYAMWFFVGTEQQLFQGFNQNMAPSREQAIVFYKSASSWGAEIAGEKVVFYDDNTNGKLFEKDPYDYGLRDYTAGETLDDEVRLPTLDGMKIGSGPVGPFSNWVSLKGNWYHLRGKDGNSKVGARPVNPEYFKTGTIQLKWMGSRKLKPKVLIVAGADSFSSARFNIASGKPVEVPVGSYHIEFGRIEQGKGDRILSANILPGACEDVVVMEGENSVLNMGTPFKLDYTRGGEGNDVSISAYSIKVVGLSGAIFTHINGAAPAPDVMVTKNSAGKGAKVVGGFVNILDSDTLVSITSNKKYRRKIHIYAAFFPISKGTAEADPVLKLKVPVGSLVGLQEKKNKLFGKLLPIYK